jgi:hypothetical protein
LNRLVGSNPTLSAFSGFGCRAAGFSKKARGEPAVRERDEKPGA